MVFSANILRGYYFSFVYGWEDNSNNNSLIEFEYNSAHVIV